MAPAADHPQDGAPDRAGLVLVTLIREKALLVGYPAADTEPSAPPDLPAGSPQPTPA